MEKCINKICSFRLKYTNISFRKFSSNQQASGLSQTTMQIPEHDEYELDKVAKISIKKMGERMKQFENKGETSLLDPDLPFIVRLDGHKFSTFTRNFKKPYDERTMVLTTKDLMVSFPCVTAFTESDEISLIFPESKIKDDPSPIPFSGRILKFSTVASSLCSARFNFHLGNIGRSQKEAPNEKEQRAIQAMTSGVAHFDARAFNMPGDDECLNNILWRSADCTRNSINHLALSMFSTAQLDSMSSSSRVIMMRNKGYDWKTSPEWFRFGVLLKKKTVLRKGMNPKENIMVDTERTEIGYASASLLKKEFSQRNIAFLMTKLLTKETFPEFYDSFTTISEDSL